MDEADSRFHRYWEQAWRTKWGGAADAAGMTMLAGGALMTSPFFAETPVGVSSGLAAVGAAWLAHRLSRTWNERPIQPSKLNIKSATLPKGDGILLGYTTDNGRAFTIPDDDIMRHVLIVGQSGVGKTVAGSLMLFQQIQRGGGLLFVDAKIDIDNLNSIYRMAAWCGREHDVLVINPGDPSLSNLYNPILAGDPDEKAATILATIPQSENSPGTDFYRQAANQGLVTLIAALQAAGLPYNFLDLSILLTNPKALNDLEQTVVQRAPKHKATIGLQLFLEQYKVPTKEGGTTVDMKRLKETFGGIGGRMFTFGTGNFGEVMNTYDPEVKLFEAIRDNKIIYVALPTMGKAEAASNFGKLLIGDLRTAVSKVQLLPAHERPNPSFLCFLDEAGSYVTPSLSRLFEQARSANMILMPAVQTLANFEAVSPEFAQMVVGNTWTKIYFKLGSQETAEAAADLIGMRRRVARTVSYSDSRSTSKSFLRATPESSSSDGGGVSETEKEEETYRVSPDDLKALDKGECIVTFGGDALYNLRVPLLRLAPEAYKAFGDYRVKRFRDNRVKGLDLFKNHDRYVSKSKGGDFEG